MRKKIIAAVIVTALALCLAFTLAACNNNDGDGGKEGGNTGTLYSIQAPAASDVYSVSGLPESAREGDAVTFTVTLTHPADSVLNYVEVYGSEMKYNKLTPADDGSYSFTMPAEPVRVTVDADYYPDNDTDNFLTWDEDNPTTAEKWIPHYDGDMYFDSDNLSLVANVTDDPKGTGGWFNNHEERAFSLNEDVIPNDALTVTYEEEGNRNDAYMFTVDIDRSKINAGTAKIVLVVENNSSFGDESVLACTVTVTEREPYETVEIWTETVIFDVSAIENDEHTEDLYFVFSDKDYDDNTYAQQFQTILETDYEIVDGKIELTINYVVGHEYEITLDYRMGEPKPAVPDISFQNADGGEYQSGVLTFSKDGGSIELALE